MEKSFSYYGTVPLNYIHCLQLDVRWLHTAALLDRPLIPYNTCIGGPLTILRKNYFPHWTAGQKPQTENLQVVTKVPRGLNIAPVLYLRRVRGYYYICESTGHLADPSPTTHRTEAMKNATLGLERKIELDAMLRRNGYSTKKILGWVEMSRPLFLFLFLLQLSYSAAVFFEVLHIITHMKRTAVSAHLTPET